MFKNNNLLLLYNKMPPMTPEAKGKLLQRLKEGREKIKAARAAAKASGQPDPKPRKPRAKKMAAVDPGAAPAANEKIAPIDGAPRNAVNAVAAAPVDPTASKSTPIDVPNLPGEGKEVASKKDIVENADSAPKRKESDKGMSSTGRPTAANDNDLVVNQETGNQVIETNYPGQKESIKKALKANKDENKPLANAPAPDPPKKTVAKVKTHVPDVKAVEGRLPFSFAATRKLLYQ
jgi:hypothetical protein